MAFQYLGELVEMKKIEFLQKIVNFFQKKITWVRFQYQNNLVDSILEHSIISSGAIFTRKQIDCVCGTGTMCALVVVDKLTCWMVAFDLKGKKKSKGDVLSGQHSISFSETMCALLVVDKLTCE